MLTVGARPRHEQQAGGQSRSSDRKCLQQFTSLHDHSFNKTRNRKDWRPHLCVLTCASSPVHPHLCHPHLYILACPSSPVHPRLYILTCASSPVHPHLCIITCASSPVAPSPVHPHLSILTCPSSPVHTHLCILTCASSPVAPSPVHPHLWHPHLCILTCASSPMAAGRALSRAHWHTCSWLQHSDLGAHRNHLGLGMDRCWFQQELKNRPHPSPTPTLAPLIWKFTSPHLLATPWFPKG